MISALNLSAAAGRTQFSATGLAIEWKGHDRIDAPAFAYADHDTTTRRSPARFTVKHDMEIGDCVGVRQAGQAEACLTKEAC